MMSTAETFCEQLALGIRARQTLLVVRTREERRALSLIGEVGRQTDRAVVSWDLAEAFTVVAGEPAEPLPRARDAVTALEHIDAAAGGDLFVLRDFHAVWDNATIRRKLRSVAQRLRASGKSILVTGPVSELPEDLRDEAVLLELPPPDESELAEVLRPLCEAGGVHVELGEAGRERLVQAALGLSAEQAQRVFAEAIASRGKLDETDIERVTQAKKQIIRESRALEFFPLSETIDDVGGLERLKRWLRLREQAFSQAARDFGLPAPKGIALIGIPGTGKSLTARMIGGLWRLPLLRLDVGALFGSLVGESEQRTREALRLAETVAPCVLWIDELEKALGGGSGAGDGGTSTRVVGTILTWMQEKAAACFVVATANDIARLPPEMLRKGRFDEIFFLDLPTAAEREAILSVHLQKRRRMPFDFDLPALVAASEGCVGAEIEQAIIDAMYQAFAADHDVTSDDVHQALTQQVPLSVTAQETVQMLRNWMAEGRAQRASEPG